MTGTSLGSFAAVLLYLDCDIDKTLTIIKGYHDFMRNTRFGAFLVDACYMAREFHAVNVQLNHDDAFFKQQQRKYGVETLYFGASAVDIRGLKLHAMRLHSFRSMEEMCYAMTVSCRTFPFFTTPGHFNGRLCVDGGFTALLTVSEKDQAREMIKIQLECLGADDDAVIVGDKQTFSIWDCVDRRLSLANDMERLRVGYAQAAKWKTVQKLMSKGLRLKQQYEAVAQSRELWENHIEQMKRDNDVIIKRFVSRHES
eukprot:CAMPEP_0202710224 /NCGR_PEP_ID=MMETSP1385-20130828/22240_1 /ASSEMBLY_ACC=CAM_ASM_000861 /TAXON_ID=933848 /ORGANISM="Elphidium margaritaceum" /LENGTH=255 /DNA_ID=CAMNT_0049369715 /DNA_START=249 /DNA_END=1016 /DNA_ORIENTATION=+